MGENSKDSLLSGKLAVARDVGVLLEVDVREVAPFLMPAQTLRFPSERHAPGGFTLGRAGAQTELPVARAAVDGSVLVDATVVYVEGGQERRHLPDDAI